MNTPIQITAIVGSQRSGTTLTAQILGAHSQAIAIDENDGLYEWSSAALNGQSNQHQLLAAAIAKAQIKYTNKSEHFSSQGKCIQSLILKAPNLTYDWIALSKTFHKANIIYVFRDVKAIVASMKKLSSVPIVENQTKKIQGNRKVRKRFQSELEQLTSQTVAPHVKMALIALIKMSFLTDFRKTSLKVSTVKYESLIASPHDNISRLLTHISLPFETQCEHYTSQYQGIAPGETDRTQQINNCSIHKWKTELSSHEISDINELAKEFCHLHKPSLKCN